MSVLRLPLRTLTLLGAGLEYGLAPYLVDSQIIARAAFPWFVNPNGLNQVFVWIHPVAYVYCWGPFFVGFRGREHRPGRRGMNLCRSPGSSSR